MTEEEHFRLFRIWTMIKGRCEFPANVQYEDYGGRGIYLCEEWQDFEKFAAWAVEHGSRKGLHFDRIDNSGPYSPDNVRLATPTENARNKRNNVVLTVFGETKTAVEWAEDHRCLVGAHHLRQRVRRGWDHEKALTVPTTRGALSCKFGHEYTEENTYRPPSKPHLRECRECHRQRSNDRYHTKQREKNGLYK